MSLFSFFRRDKTAQDNNRTTERNTRPDTEKQGRRGRSAAPAEADPQLPEKQRARRRLIGSIVLVVAALIVLPLVFESKPQKPNLNIAVQVDSNASPSAPAPQPEAQPAQTSDQQPVPENAGAAAQEQATDAAQPVQAPVSEPAREAVPDRNAEQARVDKERETKADRELAEKERKAKAEREKADREREAKAKADREKADRERAEKERKAKAEHDRAERKASKEKPAKKKTAHFHISFSPEGNRSVFFKKKKPVRDFIDVSSALI